jgi:hypothetical protein
MPTGQTTSTIAIQWVDTFFPLLEEQLVGLLKNRGSLCNQTQKPNTLPAL